MKVVCGNEHTHLGIKFKFGDTKVVIDMVECALSMSKEFLEKFGKNNEVSTPAGLDMFVGDNSKTSDENCRELFHKFMAKGLFPHKRERLDALPMILVLCTRVKNPGMKDWGN